MRLAAWLLRALVFLALFAFALNNRQPVTVQGFFGAEWRTPLVAVLLLAFGAGAMLGVLAMLPSWWHGRSHARGGRSPAPDPMDSQAPPAGTALPVAPRETPGEHPPRIGL
ncbi:MAG: LapA family protein [Rubrivivax sp.]|nr:LapA family protein [Rubrivivax sp.]